MRVKLQNIGLVREAELAVTDLMVIMGPNNSGKSTIASTVYAFVKSAASIRNPFAILRQDPIGQSSASRPATEAVDRVFSADSNLTPEEAAKQLSPILTELVLSTLGKSWAAAIENANASVLPDLATRTSRRLPLKLTASCEDLGWSVTVSLRGDDVTVKVTPPTKPIQLPAESIAYLRRMTSEQEFSPHSIYFMELLSDLAPILLRSVPRGAHYLPAARAGLLQSHRLVAAAMWQRAPMVGLGELTMPALSGVIADFVSEILLAEQPRPRRKGGQGTQNIQKIANLIEEEVLGGKVIRTKSSSGYPEIEFRDATGTYPLHRTSSMISEVSPIVLLFRMAADPGDLLLIEEPESHLHPQSQTRLAAALYRASTTTPLLITTHSDFFLSKLNNELRHAATQRGGGGATTQPQTSAYFLQQLEDGTRLSELEVSQIDGIPEDSFMEVTEALYVDQIAQERILEKQGYGGEGNS